MKKEKSFKSPVLPSFLCWAAIVVPKSCCTPWGLFDLLYICLAEGYTEGLRRDTELAYKVQQK